MARWQVDKGLTTSRCPKRTYTAFPPPLTHSSVMLTGQLGQAAHAPAIPGAWHLLPPARANTPSAPHAPTVQTLHSV